MVQPLKNTRIEARSNMNKRQLRGNNKKKPNKPSYEKQRYRAVQSNTRRTPPRYNTVQNGITTLQDGTVRYNIKKH